MPRNILAVILGVIVGMTLIGGIMAISMIDPPNWMVIELPLYLLVAWAAGRLVISQTNGDNQPVNQT